MKYFRVIVPSSPGHLVRKPPKLGSVSAAASENLDVPEKYQTSLGWLGPALSKPQNVRLAAMKYFRVIVPSSPGQLVRKPPKLG